MRRACVSHRAGGRVVPCRLTPSHTVPQEHHGLGLQQALEADNLSFSELHHYPSAEGLVALASRTSLPTCLDPGADQDPACKSLLSSQANLAIRDPTATPEPVRYVTSAGSGIMRKAAEEQRGSKHVRFWTSKSECSFQSSKVPVCS